MNKTTGFIGLFFLTCLRCWAQVGQGDAPPTPADTVVSSAEVEDGDAAIELPELEVSARQEAFYNSIDRKVYNVGQDVQSATGSASDLLQNIPSVQVDVEGEVSLRGDSNVQILINGKPSARMGRDRAAALEQMSSDRIARVEVITNPSAKYSPEGTGGIINLVLKRGPEAGYFSTARINVGTDDRYNGSFSTNREVGDFRLFGSVSVRQDDRTRLSLENRTLFDTAGNRLGSTVQNNEQQARQRSLSGEFSVEHAFSERTEWASSVGYRTREGTEESTQTNLVRDGAAGVTTDYDRIRSGPETEDEFEWEFRLDHEFPRRGQELSLEISFEHETEEQGESFSDVYRTPLPEIRFEDALTQGRQQQIEISADYAHPLDDGAKLELGYSGESEQSDIDFRARRFEPTGGGWVIDANRTNRFVFDTLTHAFYGTYGRPLGAFGALAGLRFEHTQTKARQVSAGLMDRNDYARIYPSLHLTYDLAEAHRLHLSYSHRVNRPDDDDLNPYPQYDDPFNLETGNPDLEPEDIHSLEAGYEHQRGDVTYLATVYHRYRYNGITDVTRLINENTLLTTKENLATSTSSGLELGATTRLGESLGLNFSANVYRHEIDARNLGFDGRRTTIAWDAKLNAHWEVSDAWLVQVTSSYRAKRLTPQGARLPAHSTNLGMRYDLPGGKTSLLLTVSDVFNSLRDRTVLDTPTLRTEVIRQRSSRIIYLGFIYRFGKGTNGSGNDDLEFDDDL